MDDIQQNLIYLIILMPKCKMLGLGVNLMKQIFPGGLCRD